jgi:hypothetical protein
VIGGRKIMLRRLLLTKNIEVYELKETLYGKVQFYMIFLDLRRASTYEDFSYIPNFKKEDFESRDNFIQALIIYDKKITDDEKDSTYEIASGFLEDKENCDWCLKYMEYDFDKLEAIGVNQKTLISEINEILRVTGYEKQIENINLDNFKYLSQQ